MKLKLDGKALSAAQAEFVLDAATCGSLHQSLTANGYQLQKVRAPRRYPADGRWKVGFCWKYRDADGHSLTVRLTGTVDVSPV